MTGLPFLHQCAFNFCRFLNIDGLFSFCPYMSFPLCFIDMSRSVEGRKESNMEASGNVTVVNLQKTISTVSLSKSLQTLWYLSTAWIETNASTGVIALGRSRNKSWCIDPGVIFPSLLIIAGVDKYPWLLGMNADCTEDKNQMWGIQISHV